MTKQEWLDIAELIDAYRIFPRLFMIMYFIGCFFAGYWIWHLPVITVIEGTLVGTMITAGAAWFGLYNATGRSYDKK